MPLNIGYAESAGLPIIVGINAAILPAIAFALFSGSRQLVTGPDATIAALLAGVIPALAAETGAMPEELALGVAMLTGVVLIVLWLVKAGSMVRFISKSVLVGFLAGLGIEILTSQVEKIMNISVDTGRVAHRCRRDRHEHPRRIARQRRRRRLDDRDPAAHEALHPEAARRR